MTGCGGSRNELLGESIRTNDVSGVRGQGKDVLGNSWRSGFPCNFCCLGLLLRWSCGEKTLLSVSIWPPRGFLQFW